jgi:hypothetical protein
MAEPSSVPPIVHEVLNSPGEPLDTGTRSFMEPRFGYDFSKVRVHTDAKAAESARAVNAQAYTVGQDIFFGTEQYVPRMTTGVRLLAHELTHVLQQSAVNQEEQIRRQQQESPEQEGCSFYQRKCEKKKRDTAFEAFKTGLQKLIPRAQEKIEDFIKAPSDKKNHKAAIAFKQYFNWDEKALNELGRSSIPEKTLSIIELLKSHPGGFDSDCPPESSDYCKTLEKDRIVLANSHGREQSNCYSFCPEFFKKDKIEQATTAIHEMMHRWTDLSDFAYEFEKEKLRKLSPIQVEQNIDSYAALIRDLGK